ncbi:MAG: BMP family ABC transporter substrate-binding protein [Oscillospiraceae bacterium]|nr:BMP family ABC transporter substrate-binding protein [Oscillospiraceae bacterium]
MKKLLALLLALVMVLSLAACGEEPEAPVQGDDNTETEGLTAENIKIGFVHVSDPSDMGYTYNHDLGTWKMAENLGISEDQIINKYNIGEDEGCATAIEELVEAGCNIIFATSFGHGDYMTEAAAAHPEIEFCHATGAQAADSGLSNYHNYFTSIYEARYLAGVAAGLKLNEMIENGTITAEEAVIGYVAAFYFEEVISGFSAFYLGARSVCPSATMITLKADSWSDPVKEGQIAQSLIDQGAVLISQHSDNPSPATTAEAAGLFHCGYNSDMAEAAPAASIISARADWSIYLTYAVECVLNGEEIASDWCEGFNEGANFVSPLNTAVAAPGTQEKLDEVAAGLKDGSVHVFAGPWEGYYVWDQTPFTCAEGEWVEESEDRSAPYFGYIIDGITLLDA